MARNFTPKELDEIRQSAEFQEYLAKAGEQETNLALTHYLQNEKNQLLWEGRFSAEPDKTNLQAIKVPDLLSLDRHKETGEVIRALRDSDFASELNEALAKAYELKMSGKTDEFKAAVTVLQQKASAQELHSVELAMDDKGYMYDYLTVTRRVTAKVPDLSRLDETGLTGLTTAELVAMLRDPNYDGGDHIQFRKDVADLFEKYHITELHNIQNKSDQRKNTILGTWWVETHPDSDTTAETWNTSEYKAWAATFEKDHPEEFAEVNKETEEALKKNEAEFKAKMRELQENHTLAENEAIENFVSPRTANNLPGIDLNVIAPSPEPRPEPNPRPGPQPVVIDGVVMRGWNADEWQQLIDGQNTEFLNAIEFMEGVEITALKAINKLPDNFSDMTPDERRAVIEALSPVEMAKFNGAMNAASQKILETYPPRFMVFLHQRIGEELKAEEAKKDKDANVISMLTEQRDQLNKAMISKLEGYVKGEIVVDQTNIADVYDGATEMFAYLKAQNQDSAVITKAADEAQKKLDAEIKVYDEANGFDKINAGDGPAIEKAFDKTSKMADEIKLEDYPEIQPMIDGLEFESDEQKKIFVDIIKEQAARTAAAAGFKDKDEDLKAKFAEAFKESATVNIGALLSTNELLKFDGKAEPGKIDPKILEANVAKAIEDLKNGKKVKISKNAAMAHAANAVNSVAGWLNRLATRKNDKGETTGIGTNAPVLKKMYDKVRHIDKTCIKRFGPAYEALRGYGKAVSHNMLNQAINQAARYGINAGCMLLGQPGLGAPLYATFYAGQAATRLYRQYRMEKKANGGKVNGWKFLGRHLPEITQTALITTATLIGGVWGGKAVEALGHALPLDRCLSYAGMAVGGITSLVKGFKASRKEGNGVWKSLTKSFGNTALSTGTAFACGWGIGAGINAADHGLHSAGLFGETMTKDITTDDYNHHADDTVHYHKEAVDSAEDTARYAGMTPEQLNEAGVAVDAIDKTTAGNLIGQTDAQLAEHGIVRSETNADDPNAVKIVDVPQHVAITYPDNFTEHAKDIVSMWTKDAPGLLDSNISSLQSILDSTKASLLEQGIHREIDAYRVIMIAGDCGAQMVNAEVDTNMNHVDLQQKYDCNLPENTLSHMHAQGEDMEACRGKHTVLGAAWCQQHGFSQDDIKAVAGITDADGKLIPEKLTPQVMKTILALDLATSEHNEVGHTDGAPIHTDGVLDRNAAMTDGKYVHAEPGKAEIYTTYANAKGMDIDNVPEKAHFERLDQLSEVEMRQEIPMTTTFDRYWSKIKSACLLSRTGANGKTKETEHDIRPVRTDDKSNAAVQTALRTRSTAPAK